VTVNCRQAITQREMLTASQSNRQPEPEPESQVDRYCMHACMQCHAYRQGKAKASSNDMRTKKNKNRLECGFKGHSATHRRRMLVSVGERGKRCQSANIPPSSSSPRFAVTVSLRLTGSAQTHSDSWSPADLDLVFARRVRAPKTHGR
jgi:hypothetical protein